MGKHTEITLEIVDFLSSVEVKENIGKTTYYFSGKELDSWVKQKIAESLVSLMEKKGFISG
jgi:hypothetical protein